MPAFQDFYKLLGLTFGASVHDVNKAFRQLSLSCHPDKLSSDKQVDGEARFKEINLARQTLSDEKLRGDYDKKWRQHYDEQQRKRREQETTRRFYENQRNWESVQWEVRQKTIKETMYRFAQAQKTFNASTGGWNTATLAWNNAMARWSLANVRWCQSQASPGNEYAVEVGIFNTASAAYANERTKYSNAANTFLNEMQVYDAVISSYSTPFPYAFSTTPNAAAYNPYMAYGPPLTNYSSTPYQSNMGPTPTYAYNHAHTGNPPPAYTYQPAYNFNFGMPNSTPTSSRESAPSPPNFNPQRPARPTSDGTPLRPKTAQGNQTPASPKSNVADDGREGAPTSKEWDLPGRKSKRPNDGASEEDANAKKVKVNESCEH